MPITKSAKKALRSSRRKAAQNQRIRKNLKNLLKKVDGKSLSNVFSKIDKAAKQNIISANKASRIKARLTKKFGVPKEKRTIVETTKSAKTAKNAKNAKVAKPTENIKSAKSAEIAKKTIKKNSK